LEDELDAKLEAVDTNDIVNHAVTNTKLAQMNANTVKGRLSGNGTPQDIPMADLPISTAQASVNESKVDKADLIITTSTNITTDASWQGRLIKINNGENNITVTVNHIITCAGSKEGTGNISFVNGSVTRVGVDGLTLMSGNIGSTFGMTKRESATNTVNLYITNR
jgi:hypothetical protein